MNASNGSHIQRVGMVSLGCPKALVDSEQILTQLRVQGYQIVPDYKNADLVICNTCGFINAAVQESLEAIEEALSENGRVIVTGCLGAKNEVDGGNFIQAKFPKVLAVTGPHAVDEVMRCVQMHLPKPPHPFLDLAPMPEAGVKLTPKHYAYLKISEGCNHRCTFCIIPSMRGDLVSRPIGDVLREAHALVRSGVKELLVIAQDTSAYGLDTRYRTDFVDGRPLRTRLLELVQELAVLNVWVRLHYVYPYPHVDKVIPFMAEGKILPYLDVPLQHAHPRILKLMKRPASGEQNLDRIQAWRALCPDLTVRSTFIVGFPGETESEFEMLLAFLQEAKLDRVGCFTYSPVEGAAANALPDPVPAPLAQERMARLMAVQAIVSQQRLESRVGRKERVLVDAVERAGSQWRLVARSRSDAPEIDGVVYVKISGEKAARACPPGAFVDVRITGSEEHDLLAVPVAA